MFPPASVSEEEALEEPSVICQGRRQRVLTFGTHLSGTKRIKQNKLTFQTRRVNLDHLFLSKPTFLIELPIRNVENQH